MKIDGIWQCSHSVYVKEEDLYLDYLLYTVRDYDSSEGRNVYHLSIMLTASDGTKEGCCLHDIATSLEMAQRIWDLFTTELVTPITAADILEELLSDGAFLFAEI